MAASKGDGTAQKARHRARKAAAPDDNMTSPAAPTSAMAQAKALMQMDAKTWDEISAVAIHLNDFGGLIQQTSTTMNGGLTITMAAPIGYAHAALDVATVGKMGVVFFRAYCVPMDSMARVLAEFSGGEAE